MKKKFAFTSIMVVLILILSACNSSYTTLIPAPTMENPIKSTAAPQKAPADTNPLPSPAVTGSQSELMSAYEGTLENIYQQVNPSVVSIRVVQKQEASVVNPFQNLPFPFNFPGIPDQQTPQYRQGLGSGFVWDKEGHIVTNNHVINGADKIEVTYSDGLAQPASLVGTDPNSDLAVIRVDSPTDRLIPVQIIDSNQVKVGQLAIAIGNPFGLEGTMTVGIISAIGRTLPTGDSNTTGATFSIPEIIQTDAPINPGNSGGVLVNAQGQVIGVTAAIESSGNSNAGIGFAIPSTLVQKVIPALIKNGKYEHPYLGISGTTLNPEMAKAMNLDENQRGALVEDVTPGGPAEKAGLQGSSRSIEIDGRQVRVGGDVVTAVDGNEIKSMDDLIAYLYDQAAVGQKVTLSILRNGKIEQVEATLEARPNEPAAVQQNRSGQASAAWLGIQGIDLTPDIAKAINLPEDQKGILVEQVESGSPADQAGLQGSYKPVTVNGKEILIGGDVILAITHRPVESMQSLRDYLGQLNPGDEISMTILRDGSNLELSLILAQRPTQSP